MKKIMETIHNKNLHNREEISREQVSESIDFVLRHMKENVKFFGDQFPSQQTIKNVYTKIDNDRGWTTGFWTGMTWLAYEASGKDSLFLKEAESQTDSFIYRMDHDLQVDTHDLGFLYSLSCVAAYKLTGNENAKKTALHAADILMKRFVPEAGIIQAWGKMDDLDSVHRGRMIIDCCMNLPLLFWAYEMTGDKNYYNAAYNHGLNSQKYFVRDDYSTYHTYYMDVDTGKPLFGNTHQGFADESCWARGQAWGMYGFPLSYLYTGDPFLLKTAQGLNHYFINRLPEDLVCYWDFSFYDEPDERDSSAAAIAVCALLEQAKYLPGDLAKEYVSIAKKILLSLSQNYVNREIKGGNGLLLHSVVNFNADRGIDECCLWGDYFYFEALVRLSRDWKLYW